MLKVNNETLGTYVATQYAWFYIASTFGYVPMVMFGQWLMRNKAPYNVKAATFIWNILLSLVSGLGSITILLTNPKCLLYAGFSSSKQHPYAQFVIIIFCLTKWIEFGDTIFLILKKKKLLFLHVYHHFSVALYCWHAQVVNSPYAHHLAVINLSIHFVMYFYYACMLVNPRHKFLKFLRPYITLVQLIQMFIGIGITTHTLAFHNVGGQLRLNVWAALCMYVSYAYLFSMFFIKNYLTGIKQVMTLAIGTVYCGALVGSIFLWKHPKCGMILLEIMVGYLFTVTVLKNFSLPPEIQFRKLLKEFDVDTANLKSVPVSNKTTKPAASEAGLNAKVLADSTKSSSPKSPSTVASYENDKAQAASEMTKKSKVMSGSELPTDSLSKLINDMKRSKYLAPCLTQMRKRSSISRILLMIQNPWMIWALEHQYVRKTLTQQKLLEASTHDQKSLPEQLIIEDKLPLPVQAFFSVLSNQLGLYFSHSFEDIILTSLSFGFAAYTGNLLHGDFVFGILVHGCLRWVLELHTTGTLLAREFITPKLEVEAY